MTDKEIQDLIGDINGNPTDATVSHLPLILDYLLKKGVDPAILAEKADKDEDAVEGNLAKFDANGNPVDAGIAATKLNQLSHQAIYDVTANNADAKFASLSALLSSENLSTLIPVAVRCGGMSIRFERSSDNKYMQYRLLTEAFSTNVDNWEEAGKAGITSVNASIGTNDPTQAPSVDVTGPVDGVLDLTFNNIKGAKGDNGDKGDRGEQGEKGEPSVAVENYVTVEATSVTTSATDVLPVTGNSDTVYRVANWDGNQYDETAYTEYGWYNGAYKQLATRTPGIDDEPTANSQNLVKSGGVATQISPLQHDLEEMQPQVEGSDYIVYPEIVKGSYVNMYGRTVNSGSLAQAKTTPVLVKKGYRVRMYASAINYCNIGFNTDGSTEPWTVISTISSSQDAGIKEWIVKQDGYVVFSSATSDFEEMPPVVYKLTAVVLNDVRELVEKTYKKVFTEQISINQQCFANFHFKNIAQSKILLYGDSIFSSDNGGTGAGLANELNAITGATVVARGWPGYSTAQLAASERMQRIWDGEPDIIFLEYGGNENGAQGTVGTFDGSIPGEPICEPVSIETEYSGSYMIQALDYMVRKIYSHYYNLRARVGAEIGTVYTEEQAALVAAIKKPVLICTTCLPQRRNGELAPYSLRENHIRKRNAMVEVCNRNNTPICDTFNLWGVDIEQEPIYISIDLSFKNKGNYTCDGVHPNTYGYERLARVLAGTIF